MGAGAIAEFTLVKLLLALSGPFYYVIGQLGSKLCLQSI